MKKNDIKLILAILISICLGFAVGYSINSNSNIGTVSSAKGINVNYLPEFDLNDTFYPYVEFKGAKYDESNIDIVSFNCDLEAGVCYESLAYILGTGGAGNIGIKEYKVIESTPTRIVAEFEGLAAIHSYVIDLALEEVTFKNQGKQNSDDVAFQDVMDGSKALEGFLNQ